MRRRDVAVLLAGAAIARQYPAWAQQRALPLIGFLSPRAAEMNVGAFRRGLNELGYIEGQNITLQVRSAEGDNRRLPRLAAELVALKPDVIVTNGEPAIRAVRNLAGTIPIVMAIVGDPVAAGFAQSLSHPDGNLTGLSIVATNSTLPAKRLQMLVELMAEPGCIAVLGLAGLAGANSDPNASGGLAAAAKALGVALLPISVADTNALADSFAEMTSHHCQALVVMSDPLFVYARRQLVELAAQHRIAASYDNRLIVDAGGLMSYGPDTVDMFRRSAGYVAKILKGAKPGDLPIEQPTKFELAINLKAAKALGLTIPPAILAGADEIIE